MPEKIYTWSVVGAGPAGILAVGKLLDQGVDPKAIIWIDPDFSVGDLGKAWFNVPSNTRIALFYGYLASSPSFDYTFPKEHTLNSMEPNDTCLLKHIVEPLRSITSTLRSKVQSKASKVSDIRFVDDVWQLNIDDQLCLARNVVLATGSEPKTLNQYDLETISLDVALNPDKLIETLQKNESIAVFGASHSAVLVIKNLLERGCEVVNIYKHPVRYAIPQKDYILYDNTGLKGSAAEWAKAHLNGQIVPGLTRCHLGSDQASESFSHCKKAVYAIGFDQRSISSPDVNFNDYDPYTGIIAPRLFGLGVAFPEVVTSPFGHQEENVGLAKFVKYLDKVLPLWLDYTRVC
jgi:cation diffusion facilitator CzcD-associated flavoprotein CzcO